MATLLSYGFTAKRKKTTEAVQAKVTPPLLSSFKSPIHRTIPNHSTLPLPPIPQDAVLPLQPRAHQHRTERPASKVDVRLRISQMESKPPITPIDKFFVPPPVFRATLFPAPVNASLGRKPTITRNTSRGLHDSRRIQQILRERRVAGIQVNPNELHAGPSVVDRSNSIGRTPASMYGQAVLFPKPDLALQTNLPLPAPPQQFGLTPVEMDLGALEVIAMLPNSAKETTLQNSFRDPIVRAKGRNSISALRANPRASGLPAELEGSTVTGTGPVIYHQNSVVAVELAGGSIMNVITPEQSAWKRNPYVAGVIRIEPKAKLKNTLLEEIMESFSQESEIASQGVIIDELFDFINSYGDEFKVENTGIDTFWLDPPSPVEGSITDSSGRNSIPLISPPLLVPRLPSRDQDLPGDNFDQYGGDNDYEPIRHDLPGFRQNRNLFASSQRSGSSLARSHMSTPNSLTTYSPPLLKNPYSTPYSPGLPMSPPMHTPMTGLSAGSATGSNVRRVKQVKGKGPTQGGKMSFRKLLSSASAIV